MNIKELHLHSFGNRQSIENSKKVGCFYCCNIMEASKIIDFAVEKTGEETALCPLCFMDAVIGDFDSKFDIKVLNLMRDNFFEEDD